MANKKKVVKPKSKPAKKGSKPQPSKGKAGTKKNTSPPAKAPVKNSTKRKKHLPAPPTKKTPASGSKKNLPSKKGIPEPKAPHVFTDNQLRYYAIIAKIREVYRDRGVKLKQREASEIYKEALEYFKDEKGNLPPLRFIIQNIEMFIAKRENQERGDPPKQMHDFEWYLIKDIFKDVKYTMGFFKPNDTIVFDFNPIYGEEYSMQFDYVAETYATNIYPEIRPIVQRPPFVKGSPVPIMIYMGKTKEGATDIFTWKVDEGETARGAVPKEEPKAPAAPQEKPKPEKEEPSKRTKEVEAETKKIEAENRKAEIEVEKIKAENEGKKLQIELEKEKRMREKQTEAMISKLEKQYKQKIWTKAEYKKLLKKYLNT